LGIQTPWSGLTETFTIILQLVVLFADKWTTTSAEIIKSIRKPDSNQKNWHLLNRKSQSSISASLNRAGYEELKNVVEYYKLKKEW
jgi:hypothetical protein